MATPIVWDEDIPLPTAPKPAQKLVGGGLDFAPTEDLIAELNRRGYMIAPFAPTPSVTFTSPYTITTTSATTPLGLGGMQNVASLGQLMGALGGTHK
jgi:hypothetical protein